MYRHILVPIDGSELSVETVGRAVEFAMALSARITFFHATKDYGSTSDAALYRAISPGFYALEVAGNTKAILSKAEAAARAVGVAANSISVNSDSPSEAILEIAESAECDLIFMASRGPKSIGGVLLGSETMKVLANSPLPVLVSTVAKNVQRPAKSRAVAIIQDEHRSLAVVLRGLQYIMAGVSERGEKPDFQLINAMFSYIANFSNKLHHPKEDAYLFAALRLRAPEVIESIDQLQSQHRDGPEHFKRLITSLKRYEENASIGFEEFNRLFEPFVDAQWKHMTLEEQVVIPAAKAYLTEEDWVQIADAFGKNGDPRFGAEPDEAYKRLFSRIVNLTPNS